MSVVVVTVEADRTDQLGRIVHTRSQGTFDQNELSSAMRRFLGIVTRGAISATVTLTPNIDGKAEWWDPVPGSENR
jgi:hypothetical protein